MSEDQLGKLKEKTEAMLKLQRAPSQFTIFYHLLGTGKTMTVKDISSELELTPKATERAVAKLLEKGLVQRSTFREGSYNCDSKQVLLSLLMTTIELTEAKGKKK
ncbi:MAG: MarR family transcriptional regulator [Candidatus Bathyarchaeota archaeon]|nr:MarR family transcriptional regulator [Candidatus Bathyarchaeota archaeon]